MEILNNVDPLFVDIAHFVLKTMLNLIFFFQEVQLVAEIKMLFIKLYVSFLIKKSKKNVSFEVIDKYDVLPPSHNNK